MKLVKKAFIGASVFFTIIVIVVAACTTLLTSHITTHETVKTTTCYSDGTHCKTTIETK